MEIQLDNGKTAIIDGADFQSIQGYIWKAWKAKNSDTIWYAVRYYRVNGKKYTVLMHRQILGLVKGDGEFTDHIDGDGLNNRRSNLRVCRHKDNMKNRKKNKHSNNTYKCVFSERGSFRARITVNGKRIHLGTFKTAEEAFDAYKESAKQLHREFACFDR